MPEWADEIRARLASLRLAPTREAEIVEELSQHLDDRYHELIAGGASPVEAQRVALRALRSGAALAQHLTPLRQAQAPPPITPGATSGHVLGDLRQDARHAMRMLVRQRGFAAAVILTLALGIGVNTAIFSVVYAALLQPLPYDTPDQLYSVEVVIPERRDEMSSLPVRVQDYLEWSRAETAFSAVAALTPAEWNLTGDGEPERVGGARVSTNFFTALGVPPAHGRMFLPDEQQAGRDRVVIISDALWRSRFGANPAVLESWIFLNGESHVVVGIAPPTLLVPTGPAMHTALPFAPRVDVWKPIAPTPRDLEGENWNHGLIVRLKAGESLERGRMQLQTMLNASLRAVMPDMKTEFQTRMVPIREIYSGKIRLRLLLVFGAAALLLLAACTNVANLYLGRFASRGQEFAIRASLGASRSRLVRQMVIESTLLAVIGGIAGIAAAYLGVGVLLAQGPGDMRALADVASAAARADRLAAGQHRLRCALRTPAGAAGVSQGRAIRAAGERARPRRRARRGHPSTAGRRRGRVEHGAARLRGAAAPQLRARRAGRSRLCDRARARLRPHAGRTALQHAAGARRVLSGPADRGAGGAGRDRRRRGGQPASPRRVEYPGRVPAR